MSPIRPAPGTSRLRSLAALVVVLGLSSGTGCGRLLSRPATDLPVSDEPAATSEAPTIVEQRADDDGIVAPDGARAELYGVLQRAETMYEEGVEALVAGDELRGEALVADAALAIDAAAGECATLDGCDTTRFVRALDRLLSRQNLELKLQALRIAELEQSAARDFEHEPGTEVEVDEAADQLPAVGRAASATIFRGGDLRDVIRLNGPVRAALDDWLTWMRPQLIDSWRHYAFLRPQMAPEYGSAHMPEALLFAMLATESGGKVHSYSRAGAVGPLQFMRHTARQYGLEDAGGRDQRLDPGEATRANAEYLTDRLDEFDGDLEKSLAAYNGGETRLRRLHRAHPNESFWDSKIYYAVPRETREYVPRVLAAAWLFLHPEQFRLEWPTLDAQTVPLTLDLTLSLGELAICAGHGDGGDGWFRELRNLNPWLSPRERVDSGATIRVPSALLAGYDGGCRDDALVSRARELHDANYPDRPEMIRYTVRRGDTLSRIASRHRCASLREIASINRIRPPRYMLRAGQVLQIPGCE